MFMLWMAIDLQNFYNSIECDVRERDVVSRSQREKKVNSSSVLLCVWHVAIGTEGAFSHA